MPCRAVPAMAIAHIATEYVFSDFLLKEPPETRYKGLRLELALDKIVTCIAVGLPLLLISLAFAQEVSIGNCGSAPFPVPGACRGGQRARRGGGRRSGARAGRRRSVGLGCRESSRSGQGRAEGAFGPRKGKLPSRKTAIPESIPGSSLIQVCWASRPALPALGRALLLARAFLGRCPSLGTSRAGALSAQPTPLLPWE